MINQYEYESRLLGAAITNYTSRCAKAISMTSVEHYSTTGTRFVCAAIKRIAASGRPVDLMTVSEEVRLAGARGELPPECNFAWVVEMAKDGVSDANAEHYAKIIRANHAMATALQKLQDVQQKIIDTQNPLEAMEAARNALSSLDFGVERQKPKTLHQWAEEFVDHRIKIYNGEVPKGIRLNQGGMDHAFGTIGLTDFIVIAGRPGSGKAMPLSEKILLSDGGWTTHGDVQVGDKLASVDGSESYVVGVFPQGNRKTYKVTFEDGRESICADSHLWEVSSCRFNGRKVMDTAELARMNSMTRHNRRMYVPAISGDFGSHEIGIDGWLLGVLLGDGSLTKVLKLSNPEDYITDRVKASCGVANLVGNSGIDYCITTSKGQENQLLEEVRRLGLIGCRSYEKFVPREVFNCGYATRVGVLCGLLETDGWVEKSGSVMFSSSSEQLRDDLAELIHSVGGVARKTTKENVRYTYKGEILQGRTAYKLCARLPSKVIGEIKSPRLLANISDESRFSDASVRIISVEPHGEEECVCIMVDHERHLYATNGYIMTHNTELAVAVANELGINQGKAVLYKSLEMEGAEVAERSILALSGLSVDDLERRIFEGSESGAFGHAVAAVKDKPFYIDDASGCSIDEVVQQCREFTAEHANVGALIVDYVGLMEIGGKFSRHDLAIADITRKLKLLAKEQKIPVIGLFQLSRDVEKRAGSKRPVAADLRDSGSIEQDADKIIMVHRECIYDPNTPMQNVAELLNVKRRRGQPVNGYMTFKNGHFVEIPESEQGRWKITAESKPEPEQKKKSGFRYGDD